ncbi:probable secreted glycoprotein [Natronomonas pharaonis DSM 2160]|uniref:Probable secreted glycoprotein n=1 Tax=Natronomonas pharaonis (strain ATCC 35678 / DSM 2160 / CIP 103997 / JCM 8858 / NBRC 14720 / NCIMB 2260 / Gabara) TaxID=348780 RepID=A0A1U7EWX1_NATPD|nr:cohesin domain-containing protein [Natronomonas pharaonis]CAI49604.1 probable secreted glycoprotein [Natronomonas pharaonis DSM 2160]
MRRLVAVVGCLAVAVAALAGGAAAADSPGLVYFEPDETEATAGETVDIDAEIRVISVYDNEAVESFEYTVEYDPELLSVDDIEEGPWLSGGNETTVAFETDIDEEAGAVTVSQARQPPAGGVIGEGTTATITFAVAADAPATNTTVAYTDASAQMLEYPLPVIETDASIEISDDGGTTNDEAEDGPAVTNDADDADDPAPEDQAGFGVVVAIAALFSVVLFGRRRYRML